mmetsp:Transcript_43099/g.99255  ORF Transcript_43099/g.99255 Transcript_43099/m.99255 type:complete len:425 (-) Transcript_43099:123-1397(-)
MALASALEGLCPSEAVPNPCDDASILALVPKDTHSPLLCHAALMRARCKDLPSGDVIEVPEDAAVVCTLLRWIYAERFESEAVAVEEKERAWWFYGGSRNLEADPSAMATMHNCTGQAARAVRLGHHWGLTDSSCFQGRVAAGRGAKGNGTLAADVLSAYDSFALDSGVFFQTVTGDEDATSSQVISGGWPALLRAQSHYFSSMLGGHWAESKDMHSERCVIEVQWPSLELRRLLRFLHGGPFIEDSGDLDSAVRCAEFFGVPSLLSSVGDWIASNLSKSNVLSMWNFVEAHPALMQHCSRDGLRDECSDPDASCLDMAIKNFSSFIDEEEFPDEEGRNPNARDDVPLHALTPSLFRRLLSSGLLDIDTLRLKIIVKRFAKAKTEGKRKADFIAMVESLTPPAVLFNREHRNTLLPGVVIVQPP